MVDGPPILLAINQPLQIYVDLISLGADAKILDSYSNETVLHYFFRQVCHESYPLPSIETFLEGGSILALLIQAGANPLVASRYEELPQDVSGTCNYFPLRSVKKQVFLAFWHQALRICGLSGSKFCHCLAHHRTKILRRDAGPRSPSPRDGLDRLLPYDTFEEEMSAALRKWDKSVALRSGLDTMTKFIKDEDWVIREKICDRFDEWIQEVLIELQARQKKASSERNINVGPSVGGPSRRIEEEDLESDETQSSDHLNVNRSVQITDGSDSDEDWETNSSSSSNHEENWESAPET